MFYSGVVEAQLCLSKFCCAKRFKAIVPATLSRRGAVICQTQTEQHQAMKSSPSIWIRFLFTSVILQSRGNFLPALPKEKYPNGLVMAE